MISDTNNDAEAVIDIATRAATPYPLEPGVVASVVIPNDAELHIVETEKYLDAPKRKKGTTDLHNADSLIAYVTKHGGTDAELFADRDTFIVTAVFNGNTDSVAGWGDHRATLRLRKTPEWQRWAGKSGSMMNQVAFAEFIEDGVGEITEPPAADVLEMAQHFEAAVKVNFKSSRMLDNGQRQITYEETIDAKAGQLGNLTIPKEFTVGLAPFEGCVPFAVKARLRYRISDGQLSIGYVLDHPERVLEAAFDDEVAKVESPTGITAFRGNPSS